MRAIEDFARTFSSNKGFDENPRTATSATGRPAGAAAARTPRAETGAAMAWATARSAAGRATRGIVDPGTWDDGRAFKCNSVRDLWDAFRK